MRKLWILVFSVCGICLFAQQETAHWYFGTHAGLDFTSGNPVADINGALNTSEGSATISDICGNLLFYTDGVTVYTASHTIMQNGTGLYGNASSTQSAIIVPKPENPDMYYIFTVDANDDNPNLIKGLHYTVVDMSQNGGSGIVLTTEKNIPLPLSGINKSSEKVTAVANADNSGYWVITHYIDSFYAFLVTSAGVNAAPVISTVGVTVPFQLQNKIVYPNTARGYLKASPDGTKLAIAHLSVMDESDYNNLPSNYWPNCAAVYAHGGILALYDFNNATGQVSNETVLNADSSQRRAFYGVEFSPDSKKLYAEYDVFTGAVTQCDYYPSLFTHWSQAKVVQYNLQADNIQDSEHVFHTFSSGDYMTARGAMQLGLDSKIYHTRLNSNYLSRIDNPDELYDPMVFGSGPDYTLNGVYLAGKIATYGLPPFITSFFKTSISINNTTIAEEGESFCRNKELTFSFTNSGGSITGVQWDFGDGNTSAETNPVHIYVEAGIYMVTLTFEICGEEYSAEIEIEIVEEPELDIPANVQICIGSSATLEAETEEGNMVNWYDTADGTVPVFIGNPFTTPPLNNSTTYYVEAVNDEGCTSERMEVVVETTDSIEPEFSIQAQYCLNSPTAELPTTSGNGITGIWSPESIDTTTPGTTIYTFTPDEGQCSEPLEIQIEILETQIPEFDIQTVYCINAIPGALPATSGNGVTGNWFPDIIDTSTVGTQTYTFTPDAECGQSFILEVEITESIVPAFNIPTQYCLNSTPVELSTESGNGITGTWSPSEIDTSTTGVQTYTFTPDEECAEAIEIEVTVSESIISEFNYLPVSYCLNTEAEPLPTFSDNGISGSWFPNQIDTAIQGTTTYTFTPNDNQCSEEFQLAVTVYPHPEMELEEEIVICEGDSYTYTVPSGFDSYTWTNQQNQVISETQEVTFTEEGIYTLTAEINGIPCQLSRNIEVSLSTMPIITEIKSTENTLTVYVTGDGPFEYSLNEIFWQSTNVFTNLEPGIYFVYVRDMKGCGTNAKQGAVMGIPNFISPNGDGYNDTWKIRALESFPNTRLQIFDRYGKQFLDRVLNGDYEWDGRYNGELLPSGTYWYILTLETGERISGHVNLRNRD